MDNEELGGNHHLWTGTNWMLPKSCNRLSTEDVETGADARRQRDFSTGVAGLR